MLSEESVRILSVVLPRLRGWMADVVQAHEARSHLALDLVPDSVAACFPAEFLQSARVAVVDEVPTPPFRDFGLPELSPLGDGPLDGITLNDFYFVKSDSERPDLHFHELVRVAQWRRLGPTNFLLTYGVGFSLHGYRDSPLESLAHHLQLEFLRGVQRPDLIGDIEGHADVAWEAARLCLGPSVADQQ